MNKHLLAITAAASLLAGCAVQPPAPAVATADLNVGIAKVCTATPVDFSTSNTATSAIVMSNDGWCAVHAKDKDGKPFQLGLVKVNARYGHLLVQRIGGETRIEYTADNRHVGTDRFTVALRSATPNVPDVTLQVSVETSMGEGMAPAPAPTPAPATPARSTRSSTRR